MRMIIKHILVLPSLAPEGVEVKLWFDREPEPGMPISLTVGEHRATLKLGERLFVPLPNAQRWTPEDPQLLTLHLNFAGEEHSVRFGLRRIEARGEKLFLNGEPFYARGFGCDGDKCGGLARQVETPRGYRNYVSRAKEFGFNTMRLHKIWDNDAPEEFLQACDELGLFIWPEFRIDPNGDWSKLTQYWNHPSVIWWCWGNELGGSELLPWANDCYDFIRRLDPSRLVMDNSGWGAYDRTSTDVVSHHLGYYFPHGRRARMYSSYALFTAEAGLSGEDISEPMQRMRDGTFRLGKPLIAHETGNHQCFPDVTKRSNRMNLLRRPELVNKLNSDERIGYLDKWGGASARFKQAMDKLWIEQVRKSPIVEGFEMWMLSDHAHVFSGLIEDGDDCAIKLGIDVAGFREHNAADVLLADFPENNSQRIFAPGETFKVNVLASIYGDTPLKSGVLNWRIRNPRRADLRSAPAITVARNGEEPNGGRLYAGQAAVRGAARGGVYRLGDVQITVPTVTEATSFVLELEIARETVPTERRQPFRSDDRDTLRNQWNIWVFPEPALAPVGHLKIVRGISRQTLDELERGARVLLLLEDPTTIVRTDQAFPSVLARFRPQIWEWGHNLGAFIPDHPAFAGFPHDGFSDLQFFDLIDRGRKIILDDCSFAPEPIVHPVDVPMMTYSPEIYARKAAYLFELQVGLGKLLVSGFNFSADNMRHIAVRTLFQSLVRYATSPAFAPGTRVAPDIFRAYTSVIAERASPRPSPELGWDTGFYADCDANGRNKFDDRGEAMPVVDVPWGIEPVRQ